MLTAAKVPGVVAFHPAAAARVSMPIHWFWFKVPQGIGCNWFLHPMQSVMIRLFLQFLSHIA